MESQNLISFVDVGTRYEAGPEILSSVSFNINSGQFFFLTGKSGAGKTTLLRLIYHLHKQSRGQIRLFGKNTAQMTADELVLLRRKMSIVFQEYSLISHLSVFDNVALPLRVRRTPETEVLSTVMKTLQWVGLDRYSNARPLSLSGGQQQKAAVARAVITRPQILLADEPTGNLDDDSAKKLMDLFVRMKEEYGSAIIIATHSQGLMSAYNFHRIRVESGAVRFANAVVGEPKDTESYFAGLSRRLMMAGGTPEQKEQS
jgi:cell division transport system ATP-binding protein